MKIHNKLTDSADVITYVVSQFLPGAEVSGIEQWFAGHINRTYFVDCSDRGGCCVRFVLQYMNGEVFRDLDGLMQNVIRVSEQMARAARKSGGPDVERCYLHFIRTVSGEYAFKSEKLGFWRMYRYIGNAVGKLVAEKAKAKGIEVVVFDRGGYLYHGRVAELAEGAREGGLKF